jgi:ribosomal protein S12 methylthiotransferase
MQRVHAHLPQAARPVHRPRAAAGHQADAAHYAYLKISEGCNHRCTFCIIPSMRGDLVSRPIGEVMREAERLVKPACGAAGHLAGHQRLRRRPEVPHRLLGGSPGAHALDELCEALAASSAPGCACTTSIRTRSVDEVIPLMAEGKILPYLDVPFQHASPRMLKAMKRPASAENNLERIRRLARDLPRPHDPQHLHRRLPRRDRGRVRGTARFPAKKRSSTASAASPTRRSKAPPPTNCRAPCPMKCAKSAGAA